MLLSPTPNWTRVSKTEARKPPRRSPCDCSVAGVLRLCLIFAFTVIAFPASVWFSLLWASSPRVTTQTR
ncbi:hypothetical protein L2E82_42293 [Cichorium intybus]|uniref:Uncharacterized protein n=1 Tax=Cichorium intybus TaxID=13427 RepID=A0ACB8ZLR7_CICIN|nr:hypothetical protein L2E82_42293 [Cichorium intybus]